jgi:hypothetical protein
MNQEPQQDEDRPEATAGREPEATAERKPEATAERR